MSPDPPLPLPEAALSPEEEAFILSLLDNHGDLCSAYVRAIEPKLRNRALAYSKALKLYGRPTVQAEYSRLVTITMLERTGGPYTKALQEMVDLMGDEKVPWKGRVEAAKVVLEAIGGSRLEHNITKKVDIGDNMKAIFQSIARGEEMEVADADLLGKTRPASDEVIDVGEEEG